MAVFCIVLLLPLFLFSAGVWGQSDQTQRQPVPDRRSPIIDLRTFNGVVVPIENFLSPDSPNGHPTEYPQSQFGKRFDVEHPIEGLFSAEFLSRNFTDNIYNFSVAHFRDPIPLDPRWPWWSLADPNRFVRYCTTPGFNRWHFKVANVNPLKQHGEAISHVGAAPSSTAESPPIQSLHEASRGQPIATSTNLQNVVELRPPIVAQALLRAGERPALPLHVLANVEEKAAMRFRIIYLLSPTLLQRVSVLMYQSTYRLPRLLDVQIPAKQLDDMALVSFRRLLNLQTVTNDTRYGERPPESFVRLLNDATNLDGVTYNELGLLREIALVSYANYQIEFFSVLGLPIGELRVRIRWDEAIRVLDITRDELSEVLEYMQNMEDAYMSFAGNLSGWLRVRRNLSLLKMFPEREDDTGGLSEHLLMWAQHLYRGTLWMIKDSLDRNIPRVQRQSDSWVGKLETERVRRRLRSSVST